MKADIPQKYWMEVPADDKPGYQKLMREARINLTAKNYDKRMMKCYGNSVAMKMPRTFECARGMKIINNLLKRCNHTLNFKYRPDIEYAILNIRVFIMKDILKSRGIPTMNRSSRIVR